MARSTPVDSVRVNLPSCRSASWTISAMSLTRRSLSRHRLTSCPQGLGRGLPERAGALPCRRLEIVDGLDPVELALETIELGAERRDRSAVARPVAIELREDLSTPVHDRLVFRVPDLVEQRGDL